MRKRTGDKAATILDAALACFMSQGIARTTMAQIAARAGLAVGTVYLYYSDKDEVVAACADLFAARHLEESQALRTTGPGGDLDPARRLREYLESRYLAWKVVSDGSPQAAELAQAVLRLRPERIADFEELFIQTLTDLIQAGIRHGAFCQQDAARAARVLAHSLEAFFPFPGRERPNPPQKQAFDDSISWFIEVGLR